MECSKLAELFSLVFNLLIIFEVMSVEIKKKSSALVKLAVYKICINSKLKRKGSFLREKKLKSK